MKMKIIALSFILLYSLSFAYEKGKIDTHGGKGDSLTNGGSFLDKIGVFKKTSKKEKKIKNDDKKFIEIEKIEKIEKDGEK